MTRKVAITLFGFALAACTRAELGLPRIAATIVSPSGEYIVELRNEPTIDPPEQSLWLRRQDGRSRKLAGVASDGPPWTGPSAWSPDSSQFAFAVSDVHLVVVDAATASVRHSERLVHPNDFSREIRRISFVSGSASLLIEICARGERRCTERVIHL